MPKEDRQSPRTPHELLSLKDELLNTWQLLPPEHQATMLLVLLQRMRSTGEQRWTLDALHLFHPAKHEPRPDDTHIVVLPLTQKDIHLLPLPPIELDRLTIDDLNVITTRLQAHFEHDIFWEELRFQVEQLLEEKKQGGDLLPSDRKDV